MYLIRKNGKKVKAHYWLGEDTACQMWSTGGLERGNYDLYVDRCGHKICFMCEVNLRKSLNRTIHPHCEPA